MSFTVVVSSDRSILVGYRTLIDRGSREPSRVVKDQVNVRQHSAETLTVNDRINPSALVVFIPGGVEYREGRHGNVELRRMISTVIIMSYQSLLSPVHAHFGAFLLQRWIQVTSDYESPERHIPGFS